MLGSGITGYVSLGIGYEFVPPASYDITSDVILGLSVSGFTFVSATALDAYGFAAQTVRLTADLGVVRISEEIRFEPFFSWNEIRVAMDILGLCVGLDLILADLLGPPPDYSIGGVLELSSQLGFGTGIVSLTGFGATDLLNRVGGIEAPFRHQLMGSFVVLDRLRQDPELLDVVVVPGFFFEEQILRLEFGRWGVITSGTAWLDNAGLARTVWEMGYRLDDPSISFLAVIDVLGWVTVSGLDLVLDLIMDGVRFTSHTAFVETTPPAPAPILFDGQAFAVAFPLGPAQIITATQFDASFLFAGLDIGVDARIEPVWLRSVTQFDGTGFVEQSLRAQAMVLGATLEALIAFDFSGILRASAGIALSF